LSARACGASLGLITTCETLFQNKTGQSIPPQLGLLDHEVERQVRALFERTFTDGAFRRHRHRPQQPQNARQPIDTQRSAIVTVARDVPPSKAPLPMDLQPQRP
jgi:hypothetical protein